MALAQSELRVDSQQILDLALETRAGIEIERQLTSKLQNLPQRICIVGNPEDLVHLDWPNEWRREALIRSRAPMPAACEIRSADSKIAAVTSSYPSASASAIAGVARTRPVGGFLLGQG